MSRFYALILILAAVAVEAFHSTSLRYEKPTSMKMLFNFGGSSSSSSSSGLPVCVVTGTTSGLGRETARELLKLGKYEVVLANRDVEKMKQIAKREGFDDLPGKYTILPLDLGSFESTRAFVKLLKSKYPKPINRLVCNAAVYQPANLKEAGKPRFTTDGFEEQLQINHLSHFLLCNLLFGDLTKAAKTKSGARMIIVGSITGNDNTVGGGVVYPLADLGNLEGLARGGKKPIAMIDGKPFNGAKAYKDSKVCNMQTINELHRRYHKTTGITFSTMYPGCIAETQLFREKRTWFRQLFPLFMRYVTGGYVGENEAGQRMAQVVDDARCVESGVYWSWNGGARTVAYKDILDGGKLKGAGGSGGEIFANLPSAKVRDEVTSALMWDYSSNICGIKWPKADVVVESNFAKAAKSA